MGEQAAILAQLRSEEVQRALGEAGAWLEGAAPAAPAAPVAQETRG